MTNKMVRTFFDFARRRALHALLFAIIPIPLWILVRGGYSDAFTWKNAGMVLLAAAIVWALLIITDMIVDALQRVGRNRNS